jgi:nanoRNase/pAp phosphatase (c-di-AMP/oligoRNAs hydrolase)
MNNKNLCIYHNDLDGLSSYMVLKWFYPTIQFDTISINSNPEINNVLTSWMVHNNFKNYNNIYILDLDTSQCQDIIDHPHTIIIDHHESNFYNKKPFKNAKDVVKVYSSCVRLLYTILKRLTKKDLTRPQLAYISLVDDYDSYQLKSPLSKQLNIVFNATNKRETEFIRIFNNGFNGFNNFQKNMIRLFENKFNQIIKGLQLYKGKLIWDDKPYNVISTICTTMINEVADYLLKIYKADIVMIANTEKQKVSFRKSNVINSDELDLVEVAENLGDGQGGGHSYAAGCPIEAIEFQEFCKTLEPI